MAEQHTDDADDFVARRRDALKRLAVYGAYTAPFMLGVLTASKAVAQSGIRGGCCWVGAYLGHGQLVGETAVGAPLLRMKPDGTGSFHGEVQRISWPAPQPCRTFATVSGIALTLSDSTPVPVRRGGETDYIRAADVIEGDVVPVEDDAGFRWEPLRAIERRGELRVGWLTAGDGVYAAGDRPGRVIYTHNKNVPGGI